MTAYDDAISALHRAPFASFIAERKRLAGELKAQGDKEGAARIAKLPRPPASAWAVNQLWWRHREDFEELLSAAARVKAGHRDAGKAHRERLGHLTKLAARLLQEEGNAATEATLRRVTTTLAAIAAQGDFSPDPPGALSGDRDPPGFEALSAIAAPSSREVEAEEASPRTPASPADARRAEAERRRVEAERHRAEEEERKRRSAERERLSAALRDARKVEASQQRELTRLQRELEGAEQGLAETRALLERLESELSNL